MLPHVWENQQKKQREHDLEAGVINYRGSKPVRVHGQQERFETPILL